MAEKFILMTHPDIDGPPRPVSERAWEKVWKERGWEKVETDTPPTNAGKKKGSAETTPEPPADSEPPTSDNSPPVDDPDSSTNAPPRAG